MKPENSRSGERSYDNQNNYGIEHVNWTEAVGRLLGYEDVSSIDGIRPSFGAEWAHNGPAWVFFGCVALCALSIFYYVRYQQRGRLRLRIGLALVRSVLLCVLLLILADPILEFSFTSNPRPMLWLLVDGTDSMSIRDQLPEDETRRLSESVDLPNYIASQQSALQTSANGHSNKSKPASEANGLTKDQQPAATSTNQVNPTRADYVRALIQKEDDNLLAKLSKRFRLRVYQFDRPDGVRTLQLAEDSDQELDPKFLSQQITTDGETTALGNAFEDLVRRHATENLAGVLLISDYDQNAGIAPLSAARKLGVPIYTLGIGSRTAIDLSVDLQTPLKMKKAESSAISVSLRQQELDGEQVLVRVDAYSADIPAGDRNPADAIHVGERTVTLTSPTEIIEFPFTPEETGRFIFVAKVDPLEGEIVEQNNTAEREVNIIDDFMRLLFVEYEPTWEWRFVKEVFHRDSLVGIRGFRTYLRSADPTVREYNELFVPSLTMPRSQFFKYDVIFLGDMPATSLSTRFCEMTKEFVSQFGGGLVVMAGPRFGPGQLADTPLADMLPVIVDPDARLREQREFRTQLTPMATQYDFMRLGKTDKEHAQAWYNLGRLPWYQPVRRVEPRASVVLAEHATDTCIDGKTPQPLIAIRKYGRGEVVYLAHNEMWRLRRKYGELYYRQFWGQLIHRLGLSHTLGSQKRFVVRTDRQQYQADEHVLVTVEAYDENFEPLNEDDLAQKYLSAEIVMPERHNDGEQDIKALNISQFRPGVFEARFPVFDGGEYLIRVTDPISNDVSQVHFQVTSLSAERRSAIRNFALQQNIAAETNGKTYELDTIDQFVSDFNPPELTETRVEIFPLWSTWFCFLLVTTLMLGEWFIRKMVNLV